MSPLLRFEHMQGFNHDNITTLNKSLSIRTRMPASALNNRVSAHYLEVNKLYEIAMKKKFEEVNKLHVMEWNSMSEKCRKMKYAHKTY